MAQMSGKIFPKRGEIYWVDLDPTIGRETKKTRPGLVVSNDVGNKVSDMVMIAPITSKVNALHPFEVGIQVKGKPAKVMLNQCRAIDKSRLGNRIDVTSSEIMLSVDIAIRIVFGLQE